MLKSWTNLWEKAMLILVVDGSPVVRKIIGSELLGGGYDVVEAQSGLEALAKAEAVAPDLITLDVSMNHLDGFETCRRLKDGESENGAAGCAMRNTPVIFITGEESDTSREKGFIAGGTDYLTKPFAKGILLDKVNRILNPKSQWEAVTALVVDDSAAARHAVRQTLELKGIEVVEAVDGKIGLDVAMMQGDEINLIIADCRMPVMNGDEFCMKVRALPFMAKIPIFMLSGISNRDHMPAMFKAGVADYLVKPFEPEELPARINVHLESPQSVH